MAMQTWLFRPQDLGNMCCTSQTRWRLYRFYSREFFWARSDSRRCISSQEDIRTGSRQRQSCQDRQLLTPVQNYISPLPDTQVRHTLILQHSSTPSEDSQFEHTLYSLNGRRRYRPVNQRIQPIPATFPDDARVTRKFPEDPLLSLLQLSPNPPDFIPTQKLTHDRLDILKINDGNFLWPEEKSYLSWCLLTIKRS